MTPTRSGFHRRLPTRVLPTLVIFYCYSTNNCTHKPPTLTLTHGWNPRRLSDQRLTYLSEDGNILSKLIKEDRTPGTPSVLDGPYYVAITSSRKDNPSDDPLFKHQTCLFGQKSKETFYGIRLGCDILRNAINIIATRSTAVIEGKPLQKLVEIYVEILTKNTKNTRLQISEGVH